MKKTEITKTEAWEASGLLQDLDDYHKDEISNCFEKIMSEMIKKQYKDMRFTTIIMPIVRRLYVGINKPGKIHMIVDFKDLLLDVEEKFANFKKNNPHNLFGSGFLDLECMFISEYVENYINDLKKRGII